MSFLSLATQYIDLARPVLQKRLKNDQTSQRTFRIFLVINIYLKGLAVGTPMVIFFKTMQEDDRWADVYDDDDDGDDDDGMASDYYDVDDDDDFIDGYDFSLLSSHTQW